MAEIDSKILICIFLLLWAFGRKCRTNEMPIDPSHVELLFIHHLFYWLVQLLYK